MTKQGEGHSRMCACFFHQEKNENTIYFKTIMIKQRLYHKSTLLVNLQKTKQTRIDCV